MKQRNIISCIVDLPAVIVLAVVLFFRDYLYGIGAMATVCIVAAAALVYDIVSGIKHKTDTEHTIVSGLLILIVLATYFSVGCLHAKEIVWGCFGIGILIAYFIYLCCAQNANNKAVTKSVLLYSITLLSTYFLTA